MKVIKTIAKAIGGFVLLLAIFGAGLFIYERSFHKVDDITDTTFLTAVSSIKAGKNRIKIKVEDDVIVGDLYVPEEYDGTQKYPAIVINPPASGVKEQTVGVYAKKMQEKGYVAIAYDPRGWGESEGRHRYLSGYRSAEESNSGYAFLKTLPMVDQSSLYGFGICAGASYAALGAMHNTDIKAIAMVSPYLTFKEDLGNGSAVLQSIFAMMSGWGRLTGNLDNQVEIVPTTTEVIQAASPIAVGMRDYYIPGTPGNVANWDNAISINSGAPNANYSIYDYAKKLEQFPIVMAYGSEAVTFDGASRFYDMFQGTKDNIVVDGSGHFELYYQGRYVDQAVAKIDNFFKSKAK